MWSSVEYITFSQKQLRIPLHYVSLMVCGMYHRCLLLLLFLFVFIFSPCKIHQQKNNNNNNWHYIIQYEKLCYNSITFGEAKRPIHRSRGYEKKLQMEYKVFTLLPYIYGKLCSPPSYKFALVRPARYSLGTL